MSENIYLKMADAIESEASPWCQGTQERLADRPDREVSKDGVRYTDPETPISRCLVGHVNLAVGYHYTLITEDGTAQPVWNVTLGSLARRDLVLQHLADLVPYSDGLRRYDDAEAVVVGFNDQSYVEGDEWNTTKTDVLDLLRDAAIKYPED